ncbi:MAG TPA: alpha/beta fold hydrolase [Pseudonocardiaceae bacterium]|nr:alpha/beta fold hydrolase [Pseudonocardiaceae bacterium]
MSAESSPVLFVHGFWHGSWCWSEVIARLTGMGHRAAAVDLAGHGLRAARPECLRMRPCAAESLATEVSPVADVDLDEAGDLLVSQIKQVGGGRPITVVGHSAGGLVLTRALELAPDLVAHVVYLAAFMPAAGIPGHAYLDMPEATGELVRSALRADPADIGALRLDLASNDPAYHQLLRKAFYGDLDEATADAAIGLLTPDSPARVLLEPTTLTKEGWGSVPRTYVVCTQDMAIPLRLQRRFIADADTAFPDNRTSVVSLDSAHSPFLSMPDRVAEIVANLA